MKCPSRINSKLYTNINSKLFLTSSNYFFFKIRRNYFSIK